MDKSPREVLAVNLREEDHRLLRGILAESNWILYTVATIAETRRFLEHRTVPVVLSDSDLPDGNWRDLLADLEKSPRPPQLVVTSALADEYLWAEVLNLGGCDVLLKPFDSLEVLRVFNHASRIWHDEPSRALAVPAT